MFSQDAMIKTVVKAYSAQPIGEVLALFEERGFNSIPIVDEEDRLVGLFSVRAMLKHLLPISAQLEDGISHLDFLSESEPGVAKKLRKLKARTVGEIMEANPPHVYCDTPAWEAVRLMSERGSPIPVTDQATGKLQGLITTQSLLLSLQKTLTEVEREEKLLGQQVSA